MRSHDIEPTEAPPYSFALSWPQPWAWAVAAGPMRVAVRNWPLTTTRPYAGIRFAIHASTRWDARGQALLRERGVRCPMQVELARGALVGVARIAQVLTVPDAIASLPAEQTAWVNGSITDRVGTVCLVLDDVAAIRRPIRCDGLLGVWFLKREERAELLDQVQA